MVMDYEARYQVLHTIDTVRGYFEVFDLTVDETSHNYLANGLLCHNKLPAWYLELKEDRLLS
jgi:intein/homing endonuclease